MRRIDFYKTSTKKSPVEEFLDSLSDKQVKKVLWVLKLVQQLDRVPTNYFKKMVNTDELWEVIVDVGRDTFRFLGFFYQQNFLVLTVGFQKKTQKTPKKEIELAEARKKDCLTRRPYG